MTFPVPHSPPLLDSIRPPDDRLEHPDHPTWPSATAAHRVLVAEDDAALRELIATLLAFEGYFVTEAANANALLDAVAQAPSNDSQFDLIVTDVRMPGLSGLQALAQLRAAGCSTPAIVISALPGEVVRDEADQLHAYFLPKPFALENLRRVANRVIGTQGA
jgi:CheY-like chemotaxis protein